MAKINYIHGDMVAHITTTEHEMFVQGCNCFCTMGSGIAKQLRETYPQVALADTQTQKGSYNKLGTMSFAVVGTNLVWNAYTQYKFGTDKVHANYTAIRMICDKLNHLITSQGIAVNGQRQTYLTVNFPKIGCGLAGGDWDIVSKIIEEEFDDSVTVNVWYLTPLQ